MRELTIQFDRWTREGTLAIEFPKEWTGTSWVEILILYVRAQKLEMDKAFVGRISQKIHEHGWSKGRATTYVILREVGVVFLSLFGTFVTFNMLTYAPTWLSGEWNAAADARSAVLSLSQWPPSSDQIGDFIGLMVALVVPLFAFGFFLFTVFSALRSVTVLARYSRRWFHK